MKKSVKYIRRRLTIAGGSKGEYGEEEFEPHFDALCLGRWAPLK